MTDDDDAPDPWAAPVRAGAWVSQICNHAPPAIALPKPVRQFTRTRGALRKGLPAFVYVAGTDGMAKVGITSNPARRQRALCARVVYATQVQPSAALEVETVALGYLGRSDVQAGEWVRTTIPEAIEAVRRAVAAVSRYCHVDPALSAEDARKMRIALANATLT